MAPFHHLTALSHRSLRAKMVSAACILSCAALTPVYASDTPAKDAPSVSAAVPEGFGDLARAQHAIIDVYFGDRKVGQADVEFQPGHLTFIDPQAVVAMLPDVLDPAALRKALAAGPLDTHADLVCTTGSDRQACGRLQPAAAGVIFDQDRFRVSVFVSSHLLKVRAATDEIFLPRPTAGLSLVDSVAGTLAGGSGGKTTYALQNRAVLGDRDARIISTTSYASGSGLKGDILAAQVDKPGVRYTAGTFWGGGIDLIGRRKLLGAGIETQFDTRSDKDLIIGSPLVVSLSQRSRVDIIVNGRLLASRTYEAGNQSLDTSSMPDGAYEVVLHIQELSGASRDERRFFTKNSRIAPVGQSLWFARGGVLVNEVDGAFIAPTRSPYVEGGLARRFGRHVALDGTLVVTGNRAIAEIGSYLITRPAQIRLAALASSRADYGLLFQINSTGATRLNFNVDVRRIYSHDDLPLVPIGDENRTTAATVTGGFQSAQLAAGTFTQLIGDISYRLKRAQIGFTAFYRQDQGQPHSYAIGPTARWSVFQRHGLDISLEANLSQSDEGRSAFAGVRLQLLRRHTSFGATAGAQTVESRGEGRRSDIVAGVQGTWQGEHVLGGNLMLAGSYDHTPDSDLAHARADMRGPLGTVAADVVQQTSGGGATQYSLGFQTAAIVNRQMLAIGGRQQSDSVIAVKITDAPKAATFQILVDETPRGIVHAGETLPIAVTPYRQYQVRIRPVGGDLVHFDTAVRRVSVYPGNVAALAWTVRPVVAMFGRIIWPDGTPVGDADIVAGDAVGHTDQRGYFQIETGPDAAVLVRGADGRACRATLSGTQRANGYVALGNIPCQIDHPVIAAK